MFITTGQQDSAILGLRFNANLNKTLKGKPGYFLTTAGVAIYNNLPGRKVKTKLMWVSPDNVDNF